MSAAVYFLLLVVAEVKAADLAWEWAGTFKTPLTAYVWTAQKVDGEYADPGMQLVVLPTTATDETSLAGLEAVAVAAFNTTCIPVSAGQTLIPALGRCYQLKFSPFLDTTAYPINATGVDAIAFFAEHFPIEFERDRHYLKDTTGEDIEPIAELPTAELDSNGGTSSSTWAKAIGAAILINLCTLLGVVFLVPCFNSWTQKHPDWLFSIGNAFSAGAILATAFYLLLFESTHLIPRSGEDEAYTTANWGSMVLAGFLTPFVLDLIVGAITRSLGEQSQSTYNSSDSSGGRTVDEKNVSAEAVTATVDIPPSPPPSPSALDAPNSKVDEGQTRVLCGVLIGDFMHNFVDGIFIGAGFSGCSDSVAWSIAAATIAHELAQEIADYLILTDPKQGRLKPFKALGLNFLSGLSVMLGVCIILSQNVSNFEQGMLLAYGGGVYVHIAAAECMPQVYTWATSLALRSGAFLAFCIGCVAIGLVLLDHEHCFADTGDGSDPHAGHNHGRM